MAGKKVIKALQQPINTDKEWEGFIETPGLLVAEVFSHWSGPCVAMISTLRKIKFEIAGDLINYAVADNEKISYLERFRFTSEPVWMFIQNGSMVNFMFGANCPAFKKLLLDEIKRVKDNQSPQWFRPTDQRSPEEEERWSIKEAIRLSEEKRKKDKEDEENKLKHEAFLEQMMFELCEETALLLYPWVFFDENKERMQKERASAYSELKNDLFLECFDIAEEREVQFDSEDLEEINKFAALNNEIEVNDETIKILTRGTCLAMRLRGRPPHPDWSPNYPNICPDGTSKCPVRVIDDVENYLSYIIKNQPPPLMSTTVVRRTFDQPYWERHSYIDNENGDTKYPALWFPPNARVKVEFFNVYFSAYMTRSHPYVLPEPPLPLCAFKYNSEIFETLRETCTNYVHAINYIGVFEYDHPPLARRYVSTVEDFVNKVLVKTGREILVVIIMRVNEETFLSFAGIGAHFISEDRNEINRMILDYFPANAIDYMVDGQDDASIVDDEYFEFEGGEFYDEGEEFGYGVIEQ